MRRTVWTAGLLWAAAATLMAAEPGYGQSRNTENTLKLDGPVPTHADLDAFAWMVGRWRGPGMGGVAEEVWTGGEDGAMAGVFKHSVDGSPRFYEIMWIVQEGDGVVLRLKHFGADLEGWEEKDETMDFPLVRVEGGAAYFSGLTYRMTDDGSMDVFVAIDTGGGVEEAALRYWPVVP